MERVLVTGPRWTRAIAARVSPGLPLLLASAGWAGTLARTRCVYRAPSPIQSRVPPRIASFWLIRFCISGSRFQFAGPAAAGRDSNSPLALGVQPMRQFLLQPPAGRGPLSPPVALAAGSKPRVQVTRNKTENQGGELETGRRRTQRIDGNNRGLIRRNGLLFGSRTGVGYFHRLFRRRGSTTNLELV